MKEIPLPYIRANQIGIIFIAFIGIATRTPFIIMSLLIIETLGLLFGLKYNLFVQLAKPFIGSRVTHSETESRELAKFNNTLAVIFLGISTLFFIVGLNLFGYITAFILLSVAFIATQGFCVGCFFYFQLKQLFRKSQQGSSSV